MTSATVVTATIGIFVVAALLWHQAGAGGIEHFSSQEFVPADLNMAPVNRTCTSAIPSVTQQPNNVPGAGTAPRDAYASRKDMMQLDVLITTWLEAMSLRETSNPGSLTPDQLQKRVILQGRLATVRTQIGTGAITDSYKTVSQEIKDVQRDNATWQQALPNLEALHSFAVGLPAEMFLTPELYAQFRGLFGAALTELRTHAHPNPLVRVRIQQLEVHQQDLTSAERKYLVTDSSHRQLTQSDAVISTDSVAVIPIRVGAARLYLRQMMKVDQPLPTLFAMEPPAPPPSLAASPADVIRALKDIQIGVVLRIPSLQQPVTTMLQRMSQNPTPLEVAAARSQVAAIQSRYSPRPADSGADAPYDPSDMPKRAATLCKQIKEAFPSDAAALGCPTYTVTDKTDAETVINTVCGRLRYSVPSVSPAQFNCPA